MRKESSVIFLLLALLTLGSCSGGQKKGETLDQQTEMEVSRMDTTTVLDLTRAFLDKVKAHQLDEAVSMLRCLDDSDRVAPLSDSLAAAQRATLGMLPVSGYEIERVVFFRETDSEVSYVWHLGEPAEGQQSATVRGLIRPVREDGQWYLVLANTSTEHKESEIEF